MGFGQKPPAPPPAAPVIETDATGAAVTPTRALPPAVMQDSPWTQAGGAASSSKAGKGLAGTVLTSPVGVPDATGSLGGSSDQRKKLLGA